MTPEQKTSEAQRELQEEYRKFDDEDFDFADVEAVKRPLERLDRLYDKSNRPQERAMDANVFGKVTTGGVKLGHQLVTSTSLCPGGFVNQLVHLFTRDAEFLENSQHARDDPASFDWAAMGAAIGAGPGAASYFRCWAFTPATAFMLGPLDTAPKPKKARQAAKPKDKPAPLAPEARPEFLASTAAAEDTQETDRNMETMARCLKKASAEQLATGGAAEVAVGRLVLNGDSFGQTVENIFTLSFLVRDGRVALSPGQDGFTASYVPPPKRDGGGQEAAPDNAQMCTNFSHIDWEYLRAKHPAPHIMPHRAPVGATERGSGHGGGEPAGATDGGGG